MSLSPNANVALLTLRAVLGVVFVAHGGQKLFGWFGGDGLSGEAASMAERGLEPAQLMAVMAGLSEFGGGLLVLLGLLTPLGGLAIAVVMVMATVFQTGENGFFISEDGFEYNLVLFTICAALGIAGAGTYSVDRALVVRAPRLRTLLRQAEAPSDLGDEGPSTRAAGARREGLEARDRAEPRGRFTRDAERRVPAATSERDR